MRQDEQHAVNEDVEQQCTTNTTGIHKNAGASIQESSSSSSSHREDKRPLHEILETAIDNALLGGIAGAAAMGANVMTLMWMRTTITYQYRHGVSFPVALGTLYKEGGVMRFYRGLVPALVYAPLLRFTDTAANTGVLATLDVVSPQTRDWNVGTKTLVASSVASLFRWTLMPLDCIKINMQVNGSSWNAVWTKVYQGGIFPVLYRGSVAATASTFVGHFPWYFTFNYLSRVIPPVEDSYWGELQRRAGIGFCASIISDTASNSIRVIKVYKQSHPLALSYPRVVADILRQSGIQGLFLRGLETKILANGMQSILFTVLWKHLEDILLPRTATS